MISTITLASYEDAPSRMRRLAQVASHLADMRNLVGLYDCKGILEAYWSSKPSPEQEKVVGLVWASIGHEPELAVIHEIAEEDTVIPETQSYRDLKKYLKTI